MTCWVRRIFSGTERRNARFQRASAQTPRHRRYLVESPSWSEALREHLAAIEVLASDMRDYPDAYATPASLIRVANEIGTELDCIWAVIEDGEPGRARSLADPELSDAVPLVAPSDSEGG